MVALGVFQNELRLDGGRETSLATIRKNGSMDVAK
jgi:hypothetical protein